MQWALVGELGAAGAAVLCALLCMAAYYLIRAIAAALDKIPIPVVGSAIASAFRAVANPVEQWLVGATSELWSDAEWWMRNISYAVNWLLDDLRDCFVWDANQIAHLFNSVIPEATSHASTSGAAYTNGQIATLNRELAAARSDFSHLAASDSAAEYAKAEKAIGTVRHELTAIAATGVRTAEHYADTQAAALRRYIEQELAKANGYTDQQVGALDKKVAGELNVPIPAPIAQPGTSVFATVGAVATVGAAVAALTTEFAECAVTSCEGPNNFQNLLAAALGGISVVEIGEFLAKAIGDPAGAVDQYASEFEGLIGQGEDFVHGLLSL